MKTIITTETLTLSSQPLTQEEQDRIIKELEKEYGGEVGLMEKPMWCYVPFLIKQRQCVSI